MKESFSRSSGFGVRLAVAAAVAAALAGLFQPNAGRAQAGGRDAWQRVPDVIAALALGPGSRVADVGAGSGYFLPYLSVAVGPDGRVLGVDISERAVRQMRLLVREEGLSNVDVIEGAVDDPRLPERALGAVLVVDAYHEMTAHREMLSGMYSALEPGGRIVILDLAPYDRSSPRSHQMEGHGIGIDLVEADLREAGFELLSRRSEFTTSGRGRRQWMLVARRPVAGGPR